MNKFYLIGLPVLGIILITFILVNVVRPSDNGVNLSTHICDEMSGYSIEPGLIRNSGGSSCSYISKSYNPSYTYFKSTGDSKTPYLDLRPASEVSLSSDCPFSQSFPKNSFLIIDNTNVLYYCVQASI